jgi:hypothetical protein
MASLCVDHLSNISGKRNRLRSPQVYTAIGWRFLREKFLHIYIQDVPGDVKEFDRLAGVWAGRARKSDLRPPDVMVDVCKYYVLDN